MKQNYQPSLKINFLLNTLYEILCIITPLISAPYASRILGASNIGIYSYTNSIVMYFSLFAVMGTATYGKREVARTRADVHLNTKTFWEIELLSVFTSLIALAGWGIFVFFTKTYKIYYLILTISLLSKMFDISWFYRGLEQFKYTVTRNTIVRLAGLVCLFLFVKKENDLWIYFLFHVGFDCLGNLSMWISLPKFITKVSIKEFTFLNHLKQTFIYFVPTIATSIYTVLDKTLIGIITKDPNQNGYYEQATKLVNIVKTLCFSSLNAVVGARTSFLFEQNKLDEVKEKIKISMEFILHMSFPCCFGLISIAKLFVPVFYGPGYEKVILILQLLSPVLIISGISNCIGTLYFVSAGLQKKSSKYIIIGSFTNLILNLLLIPLLNSIGAVIGTLIAESIITILYLIYCNKFYTFHTLFSNSIKPFIASALMFIFMTIIDFYIKISNSIILLIIEILSGIFIYVLFLLIFKDEFIKILYKKIKK